MIIKMKNKLFCILIISNMIFAVSGCSQTNEHDMKNETTQETLQETEHDDIKESSDVIVSEQSIDTDSLIKEIREMINNSESGTIDPIGEIESDKDSAYYMDLMGSSVKGKVLLVKTRESEEYTEYEQHICKNEGVYYTIHHEFYYDDAAYESSVNSIMKMTASYTPMIIDKNAKYIKYLENCEFSAMEDSYYTAVKNTEMRVSIGTNLEIIGEY